MITLVLAALLSVVSVDAADITDVQTATGCPENGTIVTFSLDGVEHDDAEVQAGYLTATGKCYLDLRYAFTATGDYSSAFKVAPEGSHPTRFWFD